MAASTLAGHGVDISVFERRPSYGRKLLIAGSSGLNVSHQTDLGDFISHYEGFTTEAWKRFFEVLSPEGWITFIEGLGLKTFVGTSSRYFVQEMKASGLLRAWRADLEARGVRFYPNQEWGSFEELKDFDASGLFLGGGSWEDQPPAWPEIMRVSGIRVRDFTPANCGYEVDFAPGFIREVEGLPLKNLVMKNRRGEKAGELVVTRYGLEGTPVYFLGEPGPAILDLKPQWSEEEILKKLGAIRENLSPMRRVKKGLSLGDAALALLFHHSSDLERSDLTLLVRKIKHFKLELRRPRPLEEAISSRGGLLLDEVSTAPGRELMLLKYPGVFVGGEMLDWSAPTGGFLIQGAVTQGAVAGRNLLRFLCIPH